MGKFTVVNTPMSGLVTLDGFRKYLQDVLFGQSQQTLDSGYFIYVQRKRFQLKGTKTLEKIGVKHTMQVILARQNLLEEDFEEERETDGEEMTEMKLIDSKGE